MSKSEHIKDRASQDHNDEAIELADLGAANQGNEGIGNNSNIDNLNASHSSMNGVRRQRQFMHYYWKDYICSLLWLHRIWNKWFKDSHQRHKLLKEEIQTHLEEIDIVNIANGI